MNRITLIIIAIFLVSINPVSSQDIFNQPETVPEILPGEAAAPQGIYHEPRWVSWPGTAIDFNLLGVAQAGPVIQLEILTVKGLYVVPSIRYSYLGYASRVLMTSLDSDSKYSPASFGGGIGIRQFFALQKKNRMVFVGLFGEYSNDKATYNLDSQWESERIRNAVNVMANVGYRWWFRKDFFLHVAIYGGLSIELKDESRYQLGAYKGDLEKDYKNTPFVGLIDFTFGWNL